ncbi:TetR/AcrR family transcriptional regulator [Actinomadura macrotermitis]|uniref:HTH-type transcriptional repressor KstR2 n=1 Tax=Actinomadura macrotermitis TaxID=2585200 RepID=A0A7K0C6W3_9ACTN|nr:HTH-type transcriptional repressor KstR2 [Actinomadura macrotermitis]
MTSTSAARRPAKRGRPGHDLESVLAVAVRLFNERGYEATGMEALARALGITKSAIYHHVDSKEDLLRMATDRALDGLFEAAEEAAALDGRAIDRLEFLVERSVHVLAERLPFVTLLLRVRGNTDVERRALERRRAFDHLVAELMERAAAEGDLRPGIDPAIGARLVFGMVNSLIEWYRPDGGTDVAALAVLVRRTAFDGLRA